MFRISLFIIYLIQSPCLNSRKSPCMKETQIHYSLFGGIPQCKILNMCMPCLIGAKEKQPAYTYLCRDLSTKHELEKHLIDALELGSHCRSLAKAKTAYQGEEPSAFKRTLKDLTCLNNNPVTIPREWGIKHIPNLLYAYFDKVNEEENLIAIKRFREECLKEVVFISKLQQLYEFTWFDCLNPRCFIVIQVSCNDIVCHRLNRTLFLQTVLEIRKHVIFNSRDNLFLIYFRDAEDIAQIPYEGAPFFWRVSFPQNIENIRDTMGRQIAYNLPFSTFRHNHPGFTGIRFSIHEYVQNNICVN